MRDLWAPLSSDIANFNSRDDDKNAEILIGMTDRSEEIESISALVRELLSKVRALEYEKEARLLITDVSSLFDRGDTAWMLAATALVFLMTIPGMNSHNETIFVLFKLIRSHCSRLSSSFM